MKVRVVAHQVRLDRLLAESLMMIFLLFGPEWDPISLVETRDGETLVKGVMGNLLNAVFDRKNISYKVFQSELNFGVPLANGCWTGQSGLIQANRVDVMLGPPSVDFKRLPIMDFSWPLMFDRITILSHFSDPMITFDYMRGFDVYVWLFIGLTFVLTFSISLLNHWLIIESLSFKIVTNYLQLFAGIAFSKSELSFPIIWIIKFSLRTEPKLFSLRVYRFCRTQIQKFKASKFEIYCWGKFLKLNSVYIQWMTVFHELVEFNVDCGEPGLGFKWVLHYFDKKGLNGIFIDWKNAIIDSKALI